MVTLSLVWLLMEKQELWLVIAMMYLQKGPQWVNASCVLCSKVSRTISAQFAQLPCAFSVEKYKAGCGGTPLRYKTNEAHDA